MEKLRVTAEEKAEKARQAAESKTRQAEAKVRIYFLNSNLYSSYIFARQTKERQSCK